MKRISVNLTDPQVESFTQLADASGISFAEMLRRGLDAFLVQERQQNLAVTRKKSIKENHDAGEHPANGPTMASD